MREEQLEEILALEAIFPEDSGSTVTYDEVSSKGSLSICPQLPEALNVEIRPKGAAAAGVADGSAIRRVKHLPPIILAFTLPEEYPEAASPQVCISRK